MTFFHFPVERRQEGNLEELPLFRRTLKLPDDILADISEKRLAYARA